MCSYLKNIFTVKTEKRNFFFVYQVLKKIVELNTFKNVWF